MWKTSKLAGVWAVLFLTGQAWAELQAPVLQWGPIAPFSGAGGSVYYFNDNVVNGNVLNGQLNRGPYEQDKSGAIVNSLDVGFDAAKAAARLGDYVYFSDATGTGDKLYRTQVANTLTPWSSYETLIVPKLVELVPPASLTTDGTYLYSTDARVVNNVGTGIQRYSVDAATGELTLDWSTTTFATIAGGIRGFDWDASGYLYAVDGGRTSASGLGNTAQMYAIRTSNGAVTPMGSITYNGELYQTIREGNQIVVFDSCSVAPKGQMYVYNLASDTSLVSTTPVSTWDPDGIDKIYGAAIDKGFMWLAGGTTTYGYLVSGPSTLVWNGEASGVDDWTDAANWGGVAPAVEKDLQFGVLAPTGHASNFNDFATGAAFNSITFTNDAPAYDLKGNSINLSGPIVSQSGNTQKLSLDIELVSGGGLFDDGGRTLTVSGRLSGVGTLTKAGRGTLVLSGSNTYTGGTVVGEGLLSVAAVNALPSGRSLTIGTDGTVVLASGLTGGAANALAGAPHAVPEPRTLVLLSVAAIGVLACGWRGRSRRQ